MYREIVHVSTVLNRLGEMADFGVKACEAGRIHTKSFA